MDEFAVARGFRTIGWRTTAVAGLLVTLAVAVAASFAPPPPAAITGGPTAGHAPLSALAWLAISRGLGAQDRTYWAAGAGGALSAHNARQRLAIDFTPAGVSVGTALGRARLSLRSVRGDGRSLALAAARPAARANRVSYDRGAITEWYANGPLGLEQGFRVSRAVAPAARHTLALSVALRLGRGWRARLSAGAVELLAGPRLALRYGGLHVVDARGHTVPAWMTLRGASVTLHARTTGARFPLLVDPIVQQGTLVAAGGQSGDTLGQSVAVSGSLVAVGALGVTVGGQQGAGAVYVFTEPPSGWANASGAIELTASAPQANAGLGASVAISGGTILAGAPFGSAGATQSGTVLLFNEPASGWASETESGQLTESSPAAYDQFGYSLAASGRTVAVGVPLSQGFAGSVDVYTEPAGGWASEGPTAQLTTTSSGIDWLGWSVAISGSTIVAGAPFDSSLTGALDLYTEPSGGWTNATQTALLTISSGNAGDGLGQSVGVSGTTVVGGAPSATVGSNSGQGVAYLFTEPASGWANATESARLEASSGAANDGLSTSVAVSGAEVVAGAPGAQVGSNSGQGATYVFTEPEAGWPVGPSASPSPVVAQSSTLTDAAGNAQDAFGFSAAISGSNLVVGANAAVVNGQSGQGAAIVFDGVTPSPPVVTAATTTTTAATSTTSTSTVSTAATTAPLPVGSPVRTGFPPRQYATVTAVGGGAGFATVSLACAATTGKCTAANVALQVRETLAGSRVLAVQAKTHSALVLIGDSHVTLAARAHTTLVVHLNGTGVSLLKSRARLATGVSVSSTGHVLRLATATITRPAKRR